jgi:hypothetical protein
MGVIDDALGGSISDVVDCILNKMHQYYVLPEAVPRIEDTIRQRRENGEYDAIRSGPEFASLAAREWVRRQGGEPWWCGRRVVRSAGIDPAVAPLR